VPGYLAEPGVREVETFIADKPATLVPPYASGAQQALRDHVLREAQRGTVGWVREDARRFFITGGGAAADFDGTWDRRLQARRRYAQALRDGTFHTAGATILHIIAGRKPRQVLSQVSATSSHCCQSRSTCSGSTPSANTWMLIPTGAPNALRPKKQ
jgi:hypothetical protein